MDVTSLEQPANMNKADISAVDLQPIFFDGVMRDFQFFLLNMPHCNRCHKLETHQDFAI